MTDYLMDGVRIVSRNDVYRYEGFASYWWVFIIFGIGLTLSAAVIDGYLCDTKWARNIFIAMGVFYAVGLVLFTWMMFNANTFDHTEYEVMVDDSVSFNEFMIRYEIKDSKGQFYTIMERGDRSQ